MRKSQNSVIIILFISIVSCKSLEENTIHQEIEKQTDEIFSHLVKIRRDFHEHPELAGNEKRTSKIISNYLLSLGLEVITGVEGNGVIGILKGNKKGKKIGWRADMDAIASNHPDEVPYKSKIKGIQHGCGHDVHMAIGLGIAEVLSKNKESLNGTVYFIFQPEEETFIGAKKIVESKLFSKMNLEEIYGLHVTGLPVGKIMVKPNELYAYQKRIQIRFSDKLSGKDVKGLYKRIRSEVYRQENGAKPWEILQAFDSVNGLTNPNTMFNDYLYLEKNFMIEEKDKELFITTDIYETDKLNLPNILPKIKQIINSSEFKDEVIEVSYIQENPTVINDEKLTEIVTTTLNTIYGNETVLRSYGQIPYFNDDFFFFQQKTPGVYFLLGGTNNEKGLIAMNHAPNFRVDEESIKIAVKTFSSLLFERTNTE